MTRGSHSPISWRRLLLLAGLGLVSIVGTSCSKAQAKTALPGPVPLSVSEPPGKLVIPVEATPPPPPPAVEPPPAPSTTPTTRRPTTPATPTPTPTPPASTTTGETTPPPVVQAGGQAENQARALEKLAAAQQNIDRIKREALGRAAQDQYDSAVRFIRLAKDALTAKNFPYAAACADKAATLAALLVKN